MPSTKWIDGDGLAMRIVAQWKALCRRKREFWSQKGEQANRPKVVEADPGLRVMTLEGPVVHAQVKVEWYVMV